MTGYSQTNYNYYQDEQTTQEPEQSAETENKGESDKQEEESTGVEASGKVYITMT